MLQGESAGSAALDVPLSGGIGITLQIGSGLETALRLPTRDSSGGV